MVRKIMSSVSHRLANRRGHKYVRDGLRKDPRDMRLPISTSLCYQYMCRANVHL